MLSAVFVVAAVALASCLPPSRPLIAEVFYDAVGDDTGFEFVEIFNPLPVAWPLAGLRLEAGDGAGPNRWTLRWVGGPFDTLAAGGRFVVGGVRVEPPPGAVVQLDLQNGPDAVRLVWPDGATEVVGYGALGPAEYFCGAPAPDVPSGQSLARTPDHADRGSNAQDFAAATPSPGAPNLPARDAALIAGSLAADPGQPAPGADVRLSGSVVNRGTERIAGREVELVARGASAADPAPLASTLVEAPLAPGDTAGFGLTLPGLPAGKHRLEVRARLAGDDVAGNDTDSLVLRVGPGPLEVTEIQYHPASGEGEWVEVRNRAGRPLELSDFSLADRRGLPGLPAGGGGPLPPDSLALLAQDRLALLARLPALDATRVWQVRPWSSLNNSDDAEGIADVVTVRESDGTLCDHVPYSATGVPSGVPLERRADGSWGPAADPVGSPLAPPRPLPPLAARFAVQPRRLGPATGGHARIGWDLPWPRARIAADLYDLAGRRVARVLPETAVTGRGERTWSPGALPPGLYVMALLARAEGGAGTLTATQALRIEGSAP